MHLIYRHALRTVVFLSSGELFTINVDLTWTALLHDLRKAHKEGEGNALREYKAIFAHPYFQRVWVRSLMNASHLRQNLTLQPQLPGFARNRHVKC